MKYMRSRSIFLAIIGMAATVFFLRKFNADSIELPQQNRVAVASEAVVAVAQASSATSRIEPGEKTDTSRNIQVVSSLGTPPTNASSGSEDSAHPGRKFLLLGQKYSRQLPALVSEKMSGNYADVSKTFDLMRMADNNNPAAKKQYEIILDDLKVHADAGDVRAQRDYAMYMALNAHSIHAYPDREQRRSFFAVSKEYYIKAALQGQAHAAAQISSGVVHEPQPDPVEALAWGFIATRLGDGQRELAICVDAKLPCTEDIFDKALQRARFYIDFYEFKQVQ